MFKIKYRGDYQISEYIPYHDGITLCLQATKLNDLVAPGRSLWTFSVAVYLQGYEFGNEPKLLNDEPVFIYEDILTYSQAVEAVKKIAATFAEDQPHCFFDVLTKEFYVFDVEDANV